ncbi:DUF4297 family anti-phage-associated protein [Photorhabdus sp. RW14-46]|uniref:DUF4297 family anti-phage-associated protein n=1 Tax=Photorhabdus sp. RW14-46 TaxID=2100168 RepID=UPI0013F47170|nr:DUF4297 family anti-phage-associated protein [Photorhabdus sp. RW14-46]NHB61388.1 hypothetical protein [Photorhabdus sp. RW14-46]
MYRNAVDTIRGYCYQFDKTILEAISLNELDDYIEVESIEDIDVYQDGHLKAIQCKYYESTVYNHSVIAKPIRLMLSHYKNNHNHSGEYYLFGHYKEGHEKLTLPLTVEILKNNFLTYTENKIYHEYHTELNITDIELESFLLRLTININAKSFSEQKKEIFEKLSSYFQCKKYEAEHYYYSNAFKIINILACNKENRKITKREFIDSINKSKILFNIWIYKHEGRTAYLRKIKQNFFKRDINTPPHARFFILEAKKYDTINDIKNCIYKIQKNWSNLSTRTNKPFSPFILITGINKNTLTKVKTELFDEGLVFCDGYPFKGSEFQQSLITSNMANREMKFQFIDCDDDLEAILEYGIKNRIEIYQFYIEKALELPTKYSAVNIQVNDFSDIMEII